MRMMRSTTGAASGSKSAQRSALISGQPFQGPRQAPRLSQPSTVSTEHHKAASMLSLPSRGASVQPHLQGCAELWQLARECGAAVRTLHGYMYSSHTEWLQRVDLAALRHLWLPCPLCPQVCPAYKKQSYYAFSEDLDTLDAVDDLNFGEYGTYAEPLYARPQQYSQGAYQARYNQRARVNLPYDSLDYDMDRENARDDAWDRPQEPRYINGKQILCNKQIT